MQQRDGGRQKKSEVGAGIKISGRETRESRPAGVMLVHKMHAHTLARSTT